MSDHLPECEMSGPQCAGRASGEGHRGVMFCLHCHRRCICSALRACEERVMDDTTRWEPHYLAGQAHGYAAALDAAFEAVSEALASPEHWSRSFVAAREAINALRKEMSK